MNAKLMPKEQRQPRIHGLSALGRARPWPGALGSLYSRVRHPLMTGFLLVFWAAPVMTPGRQLLAVLGTGYVLAGIAFEERDSRRDFGAAYRGYAARVPALIPRPRRPER